MPAVDFRQVRREVREAARRAFSSLRLEHPAEGFYAVALCSDGDAQGVCPSANSEEGFHRRLKRMGYRPKGEGFVGKRGPLAATEWNLYRWNLPEWSFHTDGIGEFRGLDPLIGDANELEANDPPAFLAFRAGLYGAMILAMKDLEDEEFFAGEERGFITLLCDLAEPPEKYWFALESVRLLNPPSVFENFSGQWLSWIGDEGRQIVEDPGSHSPVYAPLKALLASEIRGG
jgi:hypothetical protein